MQQSPSCFGMVLDHASIDKCRGCGFRSECSKSAISLALVINESDSIPEAKRIAKSYNKYFSDYQQVALEKMAKKPREIAMSVFKRGIKVRESLCEGNNPFKDENPSYLRVACRELIAGGFSKRSLKNLFREELGVSERASESYVSIAFSLLQGLGLLSESSEGLYVLNRGEI